MLQVIMSAFWSFRCLNIKWFSYLKLSAIDVVRDLADKNKVY